MLLSGIPTKMTVPWANGAGGGFIRVPPVASQIGLHDGWASFTDGFPPLNFSAVAAGGVPPFGQDMNGILNMITAWNRWVQAGGPMQFDSSFATAIGGYPNGAHLLSSSGHAIFKNLADNNSNNPDSTPTNWQMLLSAWTFDAQTAGGSANAQTLTLRPAPTSQAQLANIPILFRSQGNNTGAVTLNINGLGAHNVVFPGNVTLGSNALQAGYTYGIVWTGAVYQIWTLPSNQPGSLLNVRAFGASTTYTPTTGTNSVIVFVLGGGGAGAGAQATGAGQTSVGAGGYSGAWGKGRFLSGFSGVAITIGAGGTPVNGGNGGNGGTSSFGGLISATGGWGGALTPTQAPPIDAGSGTGILASSGGNIFNGAQVPGELGVGLQMSQIVGGNGASGPFGGGGLGLPNSGGGAGAAPGAGGGGASASNGLGPAAGGSGAGGYVIVEEYS